jgi:hypothetical protein
MFPSPVDALPAGPAAVYGEGVAVNHARLLTGKNATAAATSSGVASLPAGIFIEDEAEEAGALETSAGEIGFDEGERDSC